nr:ARID DNA-binding domain-containing protein [Tanacetum cinerariifolium]
MLRRKIDDKNDDDENVPLYCHINKDFSIPFGREEFCLVTGLKFGVQNWAVYDTKERIHFRRRLFPSYLDGQPITGLDIENTIVDQSFAHLYDNDAVSLCCLGILQLVILGVESRLVVPDWMLRLANDRVAWKKYPWGSYVWPTLYSQLRNANVKRWSPLYVPQPANEDDVKTYQSLGILGHSRLGYWSLSEKQRLGMELLMTDEPCKSTIHTPTGCNGYLCNHGCDVKFGPDATGLCFINTICICFYKCPPPPMNMDDGNYGASPLPSDAPDWHTLKSRGHNQQWYPSEILGKTPRKMSETEFVQRQIKREKENRIGRCIRKITRECKHMLKKKIEDYNSSITQEKHKQYNCFNCNRKGHVYKACPAKAKEEANQSQGHIIGLTEGSRAEENIRRNKEFIQFTTKGIIKGTDKGTWDDFWMRKRHNDYLDDYFESLDSKRTERKEEVPRFVEDTNPLETQIPGPIPPIVQGVPIRLFDLYKLIDCMGGYLSVHFGHEFGAIAEILGLIRSDGEEMKKCYLTYLDVFISYYKIARAPIPTKMEEDKESLESYTWTCATDAEKKGKETLEHFGIKLEEEDEVCKNQQEAHYEKDRTHITCYKCKDLGHYAYECPIKIRNKKQARITSNKASTSKHSENEDTYSMTSDDFTIIT